MAQKAAVKGLTAGAALGAEIGSGIPVIGNAAGAVIGAIIAGVAGFLSGVKDNRIDAQQSKMFKAFSKNGYGFNVSYKKYKLGKSQTKPKSDEGYYKIAARMVQYMHDRLEYNNPGLGEYWATHYPAKMVNLGKMNESSIDAVAMLAKAIPPGTFTVKKPANDMNLASIFSSINEVADEISVYAGSAKSAMDTFGHVKNVLEQGSAAAKAKSIAITGAAASAAGGGTEWYKNPLVIVGVVVVVFVLFGKKIKALLR